MRRILRRRPSPAFILAFIALCVALGGTAGALPGVGVVTKDDIRSNAVGRSEIRTAAVTKAEAATDSVGTREVIEDALTGGQIAESTLGTVPRADGVARFAVVAANGALVRQRGVTSSTRIGEGQYIVTFGRDVRPCAYLATIGDPGAAAPSRGEIAVSQVATNANAVLVRTRGSGQEVDTLNDHSFHLAPSC